MREIKFRAKTCNGEWVQGLLAHKDNKWYISNKAGQPFAFEVRPETICQYIGLKDNNGKEIYEGDIVEIWAEDEYLLLEWDKDTAQFVMSGSNFEVDFDNYWSDELEVIDNIFDNPQLIERGN